ncbi:MAG: glucose-6-phosphate dehydrogenase [Tenericutes bacterium]|jgi:glucose-6-phosphate 1-dehydrogenase|nr:glucose-6-phosphate dehydrogenase [Mycoplasmatota bacterium]
MKKAIIIFGSTGNLMFKKLIPALDKLIHKGLVDDDFRIYAISRRDNTIDDYIEIAKEHVKDHIDWERFKSHLEYLIFDVKDTNDYKILKKNLIKDGYEDVSVYLAVPPKLFPIIAKGVSESKLIEKKDRNKRIVFEKPFGEDLESAKDINRELWKCFDENQIYRIDHYLGKEMIQNILVVRFANIIFEQSWNRNAIRSVTILSKESEGVLSRGDYYDKIGALKDMLQSHLLQMAALILMDKPKDFSSESIKDAKVKILKNLNFNKDKLILGQYKGYKDADNVEKDSDTETFVYAEVCVDQDEWKGVPIHFVTGKKLDEKRSEIIINFHEKNDLGEYFPKLKPQEDKLIIKVSPTEGVEFQFSVKEPGLSNNIKQASLDYCHNCKAMENTPEAYERLLIELLNDQRTLFTRWDEIETTWKLIEDLKVHKQTPNIYDGYEDILDILESKGVKINDL